MAGLEHHMFVIFLTYEFDYYNNVIVRIIFCFTSYRPRSGGAMSFVMGSTYGSTTWRVCINRTNLN